MASQCRAKANKAASFILTLLFGSHLRAIPQSVAICFSSSQVGLLLAEERARIPILVWFACDTFKRRQPEGLKRRLCWPLSLVSGFPRLPAEARAAEVSSSYVFFSLSLSPTRPRGDENNDSVAIKIIALVLDSKTNFSLLASSKQNKAPLEA